MPLPLPNLDDRDFQQLVEEARRQISRATPEWTDLSPSDPGMVLVDVFAYLTDTMLYRLNRLPHKAYIAFLNLLGVRFHPPTAAHVILRFSRPVATQRAVDIPRGTRVTLSRPIGGAEPPVFVTLRTVTIPAGATEVETTAYHCDLVEAELAGLGTGLPRQSVTARRPPIIAPTGDELDLVVGVEALPDELGERAPAIQYQGKAYRIWREVENFTNLGEDRFVYLVDRVAGLIIFAPAARLTQDSGELAENEEALAEVPKAGRQIRLWYRRGGGPAGNVAANTLATLKDPIPGLQVTNPTPASGGRAAETLENALLRGPMELHSLQRAVTAQDFELIALKSSGAVARAKAFTRAELWKYATPGTVEVLLVPDLPAEMRGPGQVTSANLKSQQAEETRRQIQQVLDERRPLGTMCLVNWARYKTIRVMARIVVRAEENQTAVKQRVLDRLHQSINPLPTTNPTTGKLETQGWRFGEALRASHVYDIALAEPSVRWIDRVRLLVDDVPERDIAAIAPDPFQPRTWFVGSGATLYRSLDDGDGWEPAGLFANELIRAVRGHPDRPGLLAVATQLPDNTGSRLHISFDSGETWDPTPQSPAFQVEDLAWLLRDGAPVLLLATNVGLYELGIGSGGGPVQILVDASDQDKGFFSVATTTGVRGDVNVVVASYATGGIYLSSGGGRSNTFRKIGLQGEDIRELAVQVDGPRRFLWAGAAAPGGDNPGKGCFRWELRGAEDPPEGWQAFAKGWTGGSVRSLSFQGTTVVAGSHRAGVVRLTDPGRGPTQATWQPADVRSGLPLRDPGRFYPVDAVAVDPGGRWIMAGGSQGLFRSVDQGATYVTASSKEFLEKVTLPVTWLFVSGEHTIDVVGENEAE